MLSRSVKEPLPWHHQQCQHFVSENDGVPRNPDTPRPSMQKKKWLNFSAFLCNRHLPICKYSCSISREITRDTQPPENQLLDINNWCDLNSRAIKHQAGVGVWSLIRWNDVRIKDEFPSELSLKITIIKSFFPYKIF